MSDFHYLPRSKCLWISLLQSPFTVILEPKKIKSVTVSIFYPYICHKVMGPDSMILDFSILSFKPAFSLSSFTFTKRLFIRVVSSAYLRLLIFPQAICFQIGLYPAQHFTWCTLHGDNIEPWLTPFSILNQSIFPCPVLTDASWPSYRFLRRQVRWSGIPISKNFPQFVVIHTVKGFRSMKQK